MRFTEFSTLLRKYGAEILTYPSAFTVKTGEAHWNVILRCRAIETQCFVVAAAQIGQHTEKRSSYGHARIIDPWGTVIAECSTSNSDPKIAIADIDLQSLERIRNEMPVFSHRRNDLYHLTTLS